LNLVIVGFLRLLIRCDIRGSPKSVRAFKSAGISENANTFQNSILHFPMRHPRNRGRSFHRATKIGIWNAHFAFSASTDVQTPVELLIKLLLLGVECGQPSLFNLLRRSARRNLMRARLQMADRRLWHRCYRACERVCISYGAAEQGSADEDDCGEKT
jgi:hypothetical protein